MPKWVVEAVNSGVSLKKLIRTDGFGLITKEQAMKDQFYPPYSHFGQLSENEARLRVDGVLQSIAFTAVSISVNHPPFALCLSKGS